MKQKKFVDLFSIKREIGKYPVVVVQWRLSTWHAGFSFFYWQPLFFPPCCLQRRRFLSSLFVYYTGLHDRGVESEFEWSDGSAVQYTYWKDWNPDNWANSEDCVNVRSDNDGRWNDENCRTNRPYICKKSKGYQTNGRNTYFNFYSNGAPPRPKVRLSNDVFEE